MVVDGLSTKESVCIGIFLIIIEIFGVTIQVLVLPIGDDLPGPSGYTVGAANAQV